MKLPHFNLLIIFFVLLMSFGTITFLHDPILHLLVAKMFGWEVFSWTADVITGSTTAIIPETASELQKWLFFMLPSIVLCTLATAIALFRPTRLYAIPTLIIFMFNFASFIPSINGSDSSNAMNILFNAGYVKLAILLHWGIFLLTIFGFSIFLYIYLEDNKKDSMKRSDEVIDTKGL